ncbi:hypothetical protein [Methylobacterium oxalidis]|uniref:hypothetical protein n=1 Tax=Methylobacterium oxalidis TaxID=944322 RepID=UPI0033157451
MGFLLLAEQIAAQALALAAHENHKVTAATADVWIGKAAGASGIAERMNNGIDVRIVDRARQRLLGILSASAD